MWHSSYHCGHAKVLHNKCEVMPGEMAMTTWVHCMREVRDGESKNVGAYCLLLKLGTNTKIPFTARLCQLNGSVWGGGGPSPNSDHLLWAFSHT